MKALLALVAALVALAAGVGLAAAFVPQPAATVGGTAISKAALDADLSAIAHSSDYSCYLGEEGLSTIGGVDQGSTGTGSSGVYSATFTDDWLRSRILDELRARLVSARGVHLTPADITYGQELLNNEITGVLHYYSRQAGTTGVGCGGGATAVLDSVPSLRQRLVEAQAQDALLAARADGVPLSESGLETFFTQHASAFDTVCVTVLQFKTSANAQSAQKALGGGTSFSAESAAITATTANSKSQQAYHQCFGLAGTQTPLLSGAVGTVTGPTKITTSNYVITDVVSRTHRTFAKVSAEVLTAVVSAGAPQVNKELQAEAARTSISVDPRYGSAEPVASEVVAIVPPAAPPAIDLVSPTADNPGATPFG